MSGAEEDLTQIVAELGDDAQHVLRTLVDIYRLGQRTGDKAGFERGYAEGARETKRKLIERLNSAGIDVPNYDEAGTVALTTPIKDLQGLDKRVQGILHTHFGNWNEELRERIPGTLSTILNASAQDLYDIRQFGPTSAHHLYLYLKSIGYERQDLLETRYL